MSLRFGYSQLWIGGLLVAVCAASGEALPETQHMSVNVMGRQAFVYKPQPHLTSSAGPLAGIFVLHGSPPAVPSDMFGLGFERFADIHNFLVVYPEMQVPRGNDWGFTADIPFFSALYDRLQDDDIRLDSSRAFVCGHSTGGTMALFLQNQMEAFTAAAAVEAAIGPLDQLDYSRQGHRTMVVWNHADPVLHQYAHREDERAYYNMTISVLRRHGSMQPSKSKRLPTSGTTVFAELEFYSQDTAPELLVLEWRSDPGTHAWPRSSQFGFDATEEVMKFFDIRTDFPSESFAQALAEHIATQQSGSIPPSSMATIKPFAPQFAEPWAYQFNVFDNPSIWSMAVLIPLSLWLCSNPNISLGPVLITRLLIIVCMNFVQKESVMAFPPWFLLGYQMALQVVLISGYNFRQLTCGKWSDLVKWLVCMTPFWIAQLITSLFALKSTSVSTVQVIRSLQPLMSFVMEKTTQGIPKHVSGSLLASMLLVMVGTTMYSYASVSVTPIALMWIFVNCVFTVVATVFRSWFLKDKNFTLSISFAQASVSTAAIPLICIGAVLTGEMHQWPTVLKDTPPTAWFWATMSGLVAGCFSFLQFRCQKIISGTSDFMFQNCAKVFIIMMGIAMFADKFDMESLIACCIALGGCAWYGYLRQSEGEEGTKAPTSYLKAPLIDVEEQSTTAKFIAS